MQYWRWFSRLLNGDLGNSLVIERPIGPMVVEAFSHTATLALIAIIIVALLGVALGVLGAVRHDQWQDHFSSVFALVGISVPEFFWGIVLILLFAGYLKLLPSTGYQDFSEDPLGWLRHLVLPVAILTFTLIAHVSRQMRSSMLDVLQSNYVRSARATSECTSPTLTRRTRTSRTRCSSFTAIIRTSFELFLEAITRSLFRQLAHSVAATS